MAIHPANKTLPATSEIPYVTRADPGVTNENVTRTKNYSTPRTMEGINGAFKTPQYGDWLEHTRAPFQFTWLVWVGIALLLAAVAVMLVLVRT